MIRFIAPHIETMLDTREENRYKPSDVARYMMKGLPIGGVMQVRAGMTLLLEVLRVKNQTYQITQYKAIGERSDLYKQSTLSVRPAIDAVAKAVEAIERSDI